MTSKTAAADRSMPNLIFKTTEDARVLPRVRPPEVAPDEKQVWWQWTQEYVARVRSEIKRDYDFDTEVLHEAIGAALGMKCRDLRKELEREIDFVKREVEQLRRVVDAQAELRDQIAAAKGDQARAGEDLLRREFATLREEVALHRELESLRDQVATAKSEIPRLPEIEARVDAELSQMATTQSHLRAELEKTRDRVGKMRVDQSVTDFSLKKLVEAQRPVVELRFESVDGCFTMRDMHPDAAAAWRRFAHDMVKANEGMMIPSDPAGLIAVPVRKQ